MVGVEAQDLEDVIALQAILDDALATDTCTCGTNTCAANEMCKGGVCYKACTKDGVTANGANCCWRVGRLLRHLLELLLDNTPLKVRQIFLCFSCIYIT